MSGSGPLTLKDALGYSKDRDEEGEGEVKMRLI